MEKHTRITYTAKYVPQQVVTNDELANIVDTSDDWIFSRTGIKQRHLVFNETTGDLCGEVAKQLLEKSGYSGEDIDFILVATMSPDYSSPSTACVVQNQIQASNAFTFDISAACSGFIYGLATAEKFLSSGRYQRGIVIGGETMSKIVNWEDRATCVLFGDGAAGVLVESIAGSKQYLHEILQSDGSSYTALMANHSTNQSPFAEMQDGDSRFLTMDGRKIFDFAVKQVPQNILQTIEESQVSIDEIDFVLAHQANVRILDSIAKKTRIPREKFLTNIQDYGNTSAATIPLLLHESLENQTLSFGSKQKIVLTGFGGGLTWGSILLSL